MKIRDGKTLDLSDAYSRGVGTYDLMAVRYAYAQFPDGADEAKEAPGDRPRKGVADGLLFLSDAGRPSRRARARTRWPISGTTARTPSPRSVTR